MISIVACCHGAKLCVHAVRDFRSQQWFTEVKCVVGKVKTLGENGLTLSHRTFADFTCLKIFVKAREEIRQQLRTSAALQWSNEI